MQYDIIVLACKIKFSGVRINPVGKKSESGFISEFLSHIEITRLTKISLRLLMCKTTFATY